MKSRTVTHSISVPAGPGNSVFKNPDPLYNPDLIRDPESISRGERQTGICYAIQWLEASRLDGTYNRTMAIIKGDMEARGFEYVRGLKSNEGRYNYLVRMLRSLF